MNELTLPQPAADLWAAARDVLHQVEPHADYEVPIPPHLGGGTILAARWHHRASTDVDVIFPRRGSLTDLLQDDAKNIVDRLGGKPRKLMGQRHVTVIFPAGSIDITAIDPRPDIGHKETLVDGRAELVLNNTQILRGKLERTQEMMARDLFDIATAAREDPAALASALNMLPEDRATAITWSWHEGREDIRAAYVTRTRGSGSAPGTASSPTSSSTARPTRSRTTATDDFRSTSTASTSPSRRPFEPDPCPPRPTREPTRPGRSSNPAWPPTSTRTDRSSLPRWRTLSRCRTTGTPR